MLKHSTNFNLPTFDVKLFLKKHEILRPQVEMFKCWKYILRLDSSQGSLKDDIKLDVTND